MPMNNDQYEEMLKALEQDEAPKQRSYWKPNSKEEGKWTLRLLPPLFKKSESLPYFRHLIHYVNGRAWECLNQTLVDKNGNKHLAEACPFCEMKERLYQKGEQGSEEWALAKDLKARNTFDYRGIVREDDNPTEPKIIRMPTKCHESIIEKLKEKIHGNFFDVGKGKDFVFKKKGQGIASSYTIDIMPNETPAFSSADDLKALAKNVDALDYSAVIEFTSAAQMDAALKQFLGQDEEIVSKTLNESKKFVEDNDDDDIPEGVFTPVKVAPLKETTPAKKEENVDIDTMLDDVFGQV